MFKPGHAKVGGRKKGTPNKISRDVKEMLLVAFTKLGADEFLIKQGKRNPKSFLSLLGRVIPTQVTGPNDGPIQVVQQKLMGGLSNLSDKELEQFSALLKKVGVTEADFPLDDQTGS